MAYVNATWHVHEDLFVDEDVSSSSSLSPLTAHAEEFEPLECAQPLREMNGPQEHARGANAKPKSPKAAGIAGRYLHVPHRDKPPQVVAKRNARERRRVQAVNSAFVRLRKAVPFENNRGKRVSKVKTLQYAIDYIQKLQDLLTNDYSDCQNLHMQYYYNYYSSPSDQHISSSEYSTNGYGNYEISY